MNRIVSTFATLGISALVATSSGCYVGYGYDYPYGTYGSVGINYAVPVDASLAYQGNGLWVVAGQPYPTFYASGYYWLYGNNGWYSSPYYNHGWARTYSVPPAIYGIHSPYAYRYYSPRAGVPVYSVRDHARVYHGQWGTPHTGWRDYRYQHGEAYRGQPYYYNKGGVQQYHGTPYNAPHSTPRSTPHSMPQHTPHSVPHSAPPSTPHSTPPQHYSAPRTHP